MELYKELGKKGKEEMQELIKINTNNEQILVSARELHEFLEVGTQYTKWFERMAEYGFEANQDYIAISQKRLTAQGNETTFTDHQLTVGMAKELCMLQRNEKGKEARKYFIEVEKKYKEQSQPVFAVPTTLKEALLLAVKQQEEIEKRDYLISELKPKADYMDRILKSKSLVTVNQIAKDYGMSAQALNKKLHELGVQYKQSDQWLLYQKHCNKGYTHSETFQIEDVVGFEKVVMRTKWTQKGRLFLYDLLKANGILPEIEQEYEA